MSKTVKIAKSTLMDEIAIPSLKNAPVAKGQTIVTGDTQPGFEITRGSRKITTTNILCEVNGGFVAIPLAELNKMQTADGKSVLNKDNDEISIPATLKVVESKDRMLNGAPVYAARSYKGYAEYLKAVQGGFTIEAYNELLKTGVLEGAKPVQDYVVELS